MITENNRGAKREGYLLSITIIGALFFIFGFITWANSQLIPYLKIACELSDTQSFLVATAFFAAYFVMAIPSSISQPSCLCVSDIFLYAAGSFLNGANNFS